MKFSNLVFSEHPNDEGVLQCRSFTDSGLPFSVLLNHQNVKGERGVFFELMWIGSECDRIDRMWGLTSEELMEEINAREHIAVQL